MSDVLDQIAGSAGRSTLARSLFLWHRMLGPQADAAARLRQMAGQIVGLPVGADIARQSVRIASVADGFDIQAQALPSADALFAYVSEPGLQLAMTSEPAAAHWPAQPGRGVPGRSVRRLQVLGAGGGLYRRRGPERFLLRYRLDPAILKARDPVVLLFTRELGLPVVTAGPVHPWIEIDCGPQRRFVEALETAAATLAADEVVRLFGFPAPASLLREGDVVAAVYLTLELTGEVVDVALLGETLLV